MKSALLKLTVIALILSGCAKDQPASEPESSVKLSRYNIYVVAGVTTLVDIISDGEFWLLDDNPEIATSWATNDGETIKIVTYAVGNTSIWVKDTKTSDVAEIKVYSRYFQGIYKDRSLPTDSDTPKVKTVVQAHDVDIQKIIEEDLKANAQQRGVNTYQFNGDTKSLRMTFGKTGQVVTGTYDWSIGLLILRYNGITEEYGFSGTEDGKCTIVEDLTTKYQNMYPSAGVTMARVHKFLVFPPRLL